SLVLLKNDGILPLNAAKIRKLAVIGPHADETLLGGYSSIPRQTVSTYQGLQQKLQGKAEVQFARGTILTKPLAKPLTKPLTTAPAPDANQAFVTADIRERSQQAGTFSMQRWNEDNIELADASDRAGLLDEAVALANSADAVVLVLGENEGLSREA